MIDDLQQLYNQFEKLNNQEISTSPSMSNPITLYADGTLFYLTEAIKGERTVSTHALEDMKLLLQETNNCYYQESELRPPIRINNCPYLEIIKQLMEVH